MDEIILCLIFAFKVIFHVACLCGMCMCVHVVVCRCVWDMGVACVWLVCACE